MKTILELPAEIIASIFSHLENIEDVLTARLSNKYLERSSFPSFGKRYFRKKGYILTSPSLNVLKSIAYHEDLRKYVRHVWFNPDLYTFNTPRCVPEGDIDSDRELVEFQSAEQEGKFEAFDACIKDWHSLIYSSRLEYELTSAFAKLPNLEAVGMRRSEDHRPWGWQRLKDAVGEDPRILGPMPTRLAYTLSPPTYLFQAIINSLAATHVDVKRLYTDAIEIDNILPERLAQEKLDAACRSILYLEINVSKAPLVKSKTAHERYRVLGEKSDYGEGLLKLLKATPNLLELGLQIFRELQPPRHFLQYDPGGWRHFYTYIAFQNLANKVQLNHLTRLKLEKIDASPDTFKAFLRPSHSSLTSLKIRDTRLITYPEGDRPWQHVFIFLLDDCTNLSYLLLYHLMYEHGGISFVEDPSTRAPGEEVFGSFNASPSIEGVRGEHFTDYENISLEAQSREEVIMKLGKVVEQHWYQKPMYSYAMDESLWHTDTSDEEW